MKGTNIALSFGGNIGDVPKTFNEAIAKLAENGVGEIRQSALYYSAAQDCEKNTPPFINAAVTGSWRKSPEELFELCQKIEQEAGRPKDHSPGTSRTLDIDIILFGNLIFKNDYLEIPHQKALSRFFVIFPLSEIAGDWNFPGKGVNIMMILDQMKE